jgi:hypothetical protein
MFCSETAAPLLPVIWNERRLSTTPPRYILSHSQMFTHLGDQSAAKAAQGLVSAAEKAGGSQAVSPGGTFGGSNGGSASGRQANGRGRAGSSGSDGQHASPSGPRARSGSTSSMGGNTVKGCNLSRVSSIDDILSLVASGDIPAFDHDSLSVSYSASPLGCPKQRSSPVPSGCKAPAAAAAATLLVYSFIVTRRIVTRRIVTRRMFTQCPSMLRSLSFCCLPLAAFASFTFVDRLFRRPCSPKGLRKRR